MTDTTQPREQAAIDLDKLEALSKAATPGPWTNSNGRIEDDHFGFSIAEVRAHFAESKARQAANAEFIVAARNAMPALIAQARQAAPEAPGNVGVILNAVLKLKPSPADGLEKRQAFAAGVRCAVAVISQFASTGAAPEAPIQMILNCPKCGKQHVDEPDERTEGWANPPHRSHLCHGCGYIWRPADVPTEGVKAIQTRGKNDSPAPEAPASELCVKCGKPRNQHTGTFSMMCRNTSAANCGQTFEPAATTASTNKGEKA